MNKAHILSKKPKDSRSYQGVTLNRENNVKYSMNIPRDIHNKFKKKTVMADVEMKDILMEAILRYLKDK